MPTEITFVVTPGAVFERWTRCPVEQGRLVGCTLPAGTYDVRVEVPGLAPRFLFGESFELPGPVDLGSLAFEQPGGLAVRLRDDEGPISPREASLWLEPDWYEPSSGCFITDSIGHEEIVNQSKSDLTLDDLAPGTYRLTITHPAYGVDRRSVDIEAGETTEIDAALVPLSRLEIVVDPPTDPLGKWWQISLRERPGDTAGRVGFWRSFRGLGTAEEGRWRSEPLAAGTYRVEISDGVGTSHSFQVFHRPGDPATEVEIPSWVIDGRVTLAGNPVAAEVSFHRYGNTRVRTASDDTGWFRVRLPDENHWQAVVTAADLGIEARLAVDVDPELQWVEIELPATEIDVTVTDEAGELMEGVEVKILQASTVVRRVRTDSHGRVAVRGLAPGSYELSGPIRPVRIEVREGEPVRADLSLRPTTALSGRVVFEDGRPVAGARVVALARDGSAADIIGTNRGGWFHFQVPEGPEYVVFVRGPDGHRARVETRAMEDLTLVASREGKD